MKVKLNHEPSRLQKAFIPTGIGLQNGDDNFQYISFPIDGNIIQMALTVYVTLFQKKYVSSAVYETIFILKIPFLFVQFC